MAMQEEFYAENGDIRIHCVRIEGKSSNVPLLIVPGLASDAQSIVDHWQSPAPRPTVVMSVRGRGNSSSPLTGYSLDDQASDIVAVVSALGWERLYLFGHSVGATLAIQASAKLNARLEGIIIGDFAPFYPPLDKNWRDHMLAQKSRTISDDAISGLVADAKYEDVTKSLQQVECPILLIKAGDGSALRSEDVDRMLKLFPLLEVVEIASAGHEIVADAASEVIATIESFTMAREHTAQDML